MKNKFSPYLWVFNFKKAILLILISLLFQPPSFARQFAPMTGDASVVDGNGIKFVENDSDNKNSKQYIRLYGIIAPDYKKICSVWFGAPDWCKERPLNRFQNWLNQSQPVTCIAARYIDALEARCYRADGQDLAKWLLSNGYAFAPERDKHGLEYYTQKGRFKDLQEDAKINKRGFWRNGPDAAPQIPTP